MLKLHMFSREQDTKFVSHLICEWDFHGNIDGVVVEAQPQGVVLGKIEVHFQIPRQKNLTIETFRVICRILIGYFYVKP